MTSDDFIRPVLRCTCLAPPRRDRCETRPDPRWVSAFAFAMILSPAPRQCHTNPCASGYDLRACSENTKRSSKNRSHGGHRERKEAVQPCKIVSLDNESNDGWGCSGRLKRLVVRPALGF